MRRLLFLLALVPTLAGATDVTIKGDTYTLADHPRVLLDGPAGTITTRVKDPDGAGALVAPQATDANPTFVALKALIDACAPSPTYCSAVSSGERGNIVLAGALRWFMDNSQADAKAMALHWLNNVETWLTPSFGFGCDVTDGFCGTSSWSDWPSETIGQLALAYTLMRSEMSAGERTAFAQKMFNDDTAGYQDGCTNQLQQEVGATATFVGGTTAVTGTNLSGLTAGRRVYFPNTGTNSAPGWATISTVNSATSITLTAAPQPPLGGSNSQSQTSGGIYELQPWDASTCGAAWMLNHHSYAPRTAIMNLRVMTTTSTYNAGTLTISVNSVTGLPSPPFYVHFVSPAETMRVTAINSLTLTVERAQFGTAAGTAASTGRTVHYTKYIPRVGSGEHGSNLVIQKTAGFLLMAIALADDSSNAVDYVEAHADYWIDNVYAINRQLFTGLTQGGSTSYGNGRQITMNHQVALALKLIDAALDKSGGNWLDNFADFYIMTSLPNSAGTNMTWGQPDLNQVASYGGHMWAPMQINLFGSSSDQATHWNYFQRSVANFYTSGNLTSGDNEQMIPYLLLFQEEGFTSTDYRLTKPTQKVFNVADGDGTKTMNAWISRTGYSSTADTLIFVQGYNLILTDHQGTGGPGGYRIYKTGFQLTEATTGADTNMGAGASTNMILFGGLPNLKSAAQFQRTDIDRSDDGTGWAYARFNLVNAYTAAATATRAQRNLVHLKPSGGQDYLVVFDTAATSVAKTISQNLQYDRTSSQPATMTDTVLPDLVWTGTNRRLSTKVVLPSGTGVASTTAIGPNHIRVTPCASSDGSTCANVSSAEFLIVHRPSTSITDVMPTVAALGTIDSDFSGVQIEDASDPAVVVFAEAGADQVSGSFTTTHAGTARYVIVGLAAGFYDITRGVTPVLEDVEVDESGVVAFESVAGAFTIGEGETPPPAIDITTTCPLPSCVRNQVCNTQLTYTGGTPPVTWGVVGDLCDGQTLNTGTGVISGLPTTAETCTFDITIEDSEEQTDTIEDCSRTIVTPSPTLAVQAIPGSKGVIVKFGVAAMDGSEQCLVTVSDSEIDSGTGLPIGPVASTVSTSGRSTRVVTLGGLIPEHDHSVAVECGAVASGSALFTTKAAVGGIVDWKYAQVPNAHLQSIGAAKIVVEAVPAGDSEDLDSGLYHHWGMDETSGDRSDTIHPDAANSWIENGVVSFGAGVSGNAAAINANAYLSLDTTTLFPSQTFTMAFWLKVTSYHDFTGLSGYPIVVSNTTATGLDINREPAVGGTDVLFKVYPQEAQATLAGNALTTGVWHLVVVGYNNSTGDGFIQVDDGTPATFDAAAGAFVRTSGSMFIGFNDPLAGFTGLVDEVMLWNGRILSTAERTSLFNEDFYPFGTVSVTQSCSTGCEVVLGLESGKVYNIRHRFLTAGDVTLSTTQYAPVVVP